MSDKMRISARIKVLEETLGKRGNALGKDAGLGNATVDGWTDSQLDRPSAACEKFLKYYNINEVWWKTGEGQVQNDHSSSNATTDLLINTQRELLTAYRNRIKELEMELAKRFQDSIKHSQQ